MLQIAVVRPYSKLLFLLCVAICLMPFVSGGMALLLGLLLALAIGNPYLAATQKNTSRLLQVSVVGLGAGMNLAVIGEVGLSGIGYTAIGIGLGIGVGLLIGKMLRTNTSTSLLLSVGTAICGGSAVAAVAPIIRAKTEEISVALATVFLLNASALFLFPSVGHWLGLSQYEFGMWSALAIHDTSSVVGAALQFGDEAANIATTVKLARALWIIPVSIVIGMFWNSQETTGIAKTKRPWFILGFVAAAALVTWFPSLQSAGEIVSVIAKRTLVVTLFLIGASLTLNTVKSVGARPFVQGLCLWFVAATTTLWTIKMGWMG